jgi:lipoyl-dependent peroxiredoxin
MAFSNVLTEMGNEPEELNISAVCTFDVDQVKVTKMVLDVCGRVPGLDAEGFQNAAEQGMQAYPVSNALRGKRGLLAKRQPGLGLETSHG